MVHCFEGDDGISTGCKNGSDNSGGGNGGQCALTFLFDMAGCTPARTKVCLHLDWH